ncbi:ankyrin-3-like [Strongylocentrotus purpuratus]|uniref:Uncharacterized protein n=1 Tax=Strongylocentrotus purpuratus TaxID=7668 RepID=A0A7M7PDV1_STRPU|nr:ankyrin-3-like [Strongylocentrotus purpuratus]
MSLNISSAEELSQGAEVNKDDNEGWTALQLAAQNGHLNVTNYLISQGAAVNESSNGGSTPLQLAAQNGHLDVTECLLSQGAEVNKDNRGFTPLHLAALNAHLDVAKYLISRGAEVNKGGNLNVTPLRLAAQKNHLDVTKFPISRGAEVNKDDNDGSTPLQLAAQKAAFSGHLEVTNYLISQGAAVNESSNDGSTPLQLAAQNGHLDVTKCLISQGAAVNESSNDGRTPLQLAAQNGHLDVTKDLISQCADFEKTDYDGWTALHSAANEGHLDVVTELISQGADVDKANDKGWSALYLAAAAGHVRVSSALLSQQAELAEANIIHWTEFHTAAERGDLDAMKDQVRQGAELDKAGSFGWTALHISASNGHLGMTKYLLSQGADVNSSNAFGRCALHSASEKGNLDLVEYLISEGADMNTGNDFGVTALHFASESGHLDIVESLIGHGVEADTCDADGITALHYALYAGEIDITKYLLSQGSELNKRSVRDSVILQFDGQYGHYDVVRCVHSRVDRVVSRLVNSLTVFRGALESDLGRSKYRDGDEDNTVQGGIVIVHMPLRSSDLDIQDLLVSQGGRTVGRTSLQYATEGGCLAVVRYLISQGADVNESNNAGWTALHFAAQVGHLHIVDYLLGQGAEVSKGGVDGISPLHVAAFIGCYDVTEHLLRQGAKVNEVTKEKGSTALHVGVQNGHLDITKCLLNHEAEIDATDNDGWTSLHIAAQNGYIDVMECLLQQLADVSKVTKKGSSALHLSAANGHTHVTRYLLEHGAEVNLSKPDQTALHVAAEQDQVLGQHAEKGCTAVHLATQNGYTSIIEILVSHGADLNLQSIDGQTCLHEAIRLSGRKDSKVEATPALKKISEDFYQNELSPRKALVLYLLDHGAKPDIKDNQGNLPVHYAKDEIIRHMIFSRAYRAEESAPPVVNAVSAKVGYEGKELKLEHHGISMAIPPGSVGQNDSCKITLTLVRDLPSIVIQDDTPMAAYGIRCDPPNMDFHRPVKIRIPHFTLVTNPGQVIPDIVSHIWDTRKGLPIVSRTKSSAAPDRWPYCKVLEKHLELQIDHCAEWWVLIPLEQQIIQLRFVCTPFVPDKIERGKEFDVHLHLNADIPGIEMEVQTEEKQKSYHNAHRSFPISIEAKSGDISVACEGKMSNTKLLYLKDIQNQMRHSVLLSMTPGEDDAEFSVIYVTISQAGRLGQRSQSLAFVIRYTVQKAVEELSGSDLADTDVITISQMMTVNQYYDLGVALGFTIQQLNSIEYRRFRDRQQAIQDMLVTWRKRQTSGQEAKETLRSLMKSLDSPAEQREISG